LHGRETPSANRVDNPYPKNSRNASGATLARGKFHGPKGAEISFFHLHVVKLMLEIEIAARAQRSSAMGREGERERHGPSPLTVNRITHSVVL
jgi:hypothetical protein